MRHRIPRELQNEDHWIKNLSLGDSIAVVVVGLLVFFLLKTFIQWGLIIPGVLIAYVIVIVSAFLIFAPVPEQYYTIGGGQKVWWILFLTLIHKRESVIYVSNYEVDEEEGGES